jgi:hypothetical protein
MPMNEMATSAMSLSRMRTRTKMNLAKIFVVFWRNFRCIGSRCRYPIQRKLVYFGLSVLKVSEFLTISGAGGPRAFVAAVF